MTSKPPLKYPIEGSNTYKEEQCPCCIESHNWCVGVRDWIYKMDHDQVSHGSTYHAEYNARNHAWEKILPETSLFDLGHGCPPWLIIQVLKSLTLTTCTDDHI